MTQESFEEYAKLEVDRLKKSNSENEKKIRPLLDEIEQNNKKIEHLRGYLLVSDNLNNDTEKMKRTRFTRDSPRPFRVIARKVLERHGKPLHYLDLMRRMVEEENYIVGGKNPKANMTAHLSSNQDFIKAEEVGFWGLKEWQEQKAASLNPNDFNKDDERVGRWDGFLASIKEDNNHLVFSILEKARVIKFTLEEVQLEFLNEGPFKLIDKEKLNSLLHNYLGVIPRLKLMLKQDQNGS